VKQSEVLLKDLLSLMFPGSSSLMYKDIAVSHTEHEQIITTVLPTTSPVHSQFLWH
jgi:hypothetical protein